MTPLPWRSAGPAPGDRADPSAAGATPPPGTHSPATPAHLEPGVAAVLAVLPGAVVVVDARDRVLFASAPARELGLVRHGRLAFGQLVECAAAVLADPGGPARECEVRVRRLPLRRGRLDLRVRAGPLPGAAALLLVVDLTEERRVDTTRRDFVANVSHELKTPVGALSLLAEAVDSAAGDPAAVRRFAARMRAEATRLARLVEDLLDLSRLQSDDPLAHATTVDVDRVVAEAVDAVRTAASAKEIGLVVGGSTGLRVRGDEAQLVTALTNLLANAVAYSAPRTRVAVAARRARHAVEVAVKDQGIGIAPAEQQRVFERFYRVDPARSRSTGGTGLGLTIVKHVCHNHGGDVAVWSVPGEGSTFTLRLPEHAGPGSADAPGTPDAARCGPATPEEGDGP